MSNLLLFHHDFIQVQAKYNIYTEEDQVHRLILDKWQVKIQSMNKMKVA